ncbi:MAG: SUMF1/EgtB/PvdO family nonheme iron enzyme [Saprospiraceae bacterium]|nr:SUMF1/EgtB/PvdO family nonheme iron enzyme [Saprospiraceae bacterium]
MELAGFSISPAERLRVLRVLESTGQSNLKSPEKLKFLLGPVLVQGRAEQERFYELFDRYWEELQRPWEMPAAEVGVEKRWPNWLRWLFSALALVFFIWQIIEFCFREYTLVPHVYFEHPLNVTLGDTIHFTNRSENLDSSALLWEIVNTATGQPELVDSQSFDLHYLVKNAGENQDRQVQLTSLNATDPKTGKPVSHVSAFHILCNKPPKIDTIIAPAEIKINGTAHFEAKLADTENIQLAWDFGDSTTATGNKVSHQFTKSGLFEVRLTATRSGLDGDCSVTKTHRISVGRDKAYLTAKTMMRDRVDAIVNFSWGTWILMGLLGLAIIWFWVKWATRKPPPPPEEAKPDLTAAAERYKAVDKGPYFIPFRPQEGYVRMEPPFYRLADVLRQRQEGIRKNMDVPASLKKTIAEGGFPNLLSKADAALSEYLFLIDEQSAGSHQSKLYSFLVDFLRKREVLGEAFYFKNEPIRFWNDQFPEGISSDQLARLYPFHRLIVLADGHGLLDPHQSLKESAPSLRPDAAAFFGHWKQRLLLTPMPVVSWTYREGALHGLFAIFPSDTEGLGEAIKFLERGMDGEDLPTYASWCERLLEGRRHETDLNYRRWRTAADHRDYLSQHPALYTWVCALAVYPKPDWSITLAIGRALQPMGVDVNYDNLLIISRIPWLLSGDLSPRLRKELLKELDPEAERLAREAVQTELKAVETLVQGSHANHEHQINTALQNFALAPDSPEMQAAIRELLALNLLTPKHLLELNQSVERHLGQRGLGEMNQVAQQSNQPNQPAQTPDIQLFLEENKLKPTPLEKPFFTKDFWWAVATSLLFLLIFLFAWNFGGTAQLANWAKPPYDPKGGCQAEYLYAYFLKKECVADSAVLYNNAGVNVFLEAYDGKRNNWATYERSRGDVLLAKKNFQRALVLRPDYRFAKANLGSMYFNQGKYIYDMYLDGIDMAASGPVSSKMPWEAVLHSFRKAVPFKNTALDALHAIGLSHFYNEKQDSALVYYNNIRERTNGLFFDTLQMYPNLQSLLARNDEVAAKPRIAVLVTIAKTGRPLRDVTVVYKKYRGKTDPSGKVYLEIPLGEKRRYEFTKKGYHRTVRELRPVAADFMFVVEMQVELADTVSIPKKPTPPKPIPLKPTPADTTASLDIRKFVEPEMVFVKGGTFQMGCDEKRDGDCLDNEKPVHHVTLGDFSIGKYEVTNEEYAVFLNEYGSTTVKNGPNKGQEMIGEDEWGIAFRSQGDITTAYYESQQGYEKHPVVNVTWYGAVAYTEWLSGKTTKNYRLPTEAEWEYAARGGSQSKHTKYSGGDDLDKVAWYDGNSGYRTHVVGGLAKNEIGAFDMSGNVYEWCSDWYGETYYKELAKGGVNNPKGPNSGDGRVVRGGSWNDSTVGCRSANRFWINAVNRDDGIGFRLAR